MLLSIATTSAKYSPLLGLRALLVPDAYGDRQVGSVVTRSQLAAASGRDVIGGDEHTKECLLNAAGIDGDGEDEEEEQSEKACWVSYGRRCPIRRLPPPIPSLVRSTGNRLGHMPWALRRTRTEDGSLVIRQVPLMRPEYIRARRRGGRLIMQLVERDDRPSPPPQPARSVQEEDITQIDYTTPVARGRVSYMQTAQGAAMPPWQPAAGCFEDVVEYSVCSRSLHQMPVNRLRMVH